MEQKNKLNIKDDMNTMSMDETEDEEVKRNCFGMKHYESSSNEEQESDDDSVESGVEKRPIKFGCHKPLGNGIVKPTPVALLHSTLENMIDYGTSVKKFQIIHNECAFSEEEGSDNEEVIVDNTSVSDDNESSDNLEGDQSDDSGSESDSGSPTDACDDDESAVEVEVEVEVDSEDDDLSSQSDSISISDADDESSDTDETSPAEHFDGERPEINWAVEEDASSMLVSKVSGSTNDDESVSADEFQNLIEKPEASDMCFSENEVSENEVEVNPEKELDGEDYDVMDCLIDPEQEIHQTHMQPLKRVLSTQHAMQVTPDDDGSQSKRSCRRTSLNIQERKVIPPFLPVLSLGQSAMSLHLAQRNRESPQLTVSTQEDVVDNQLAEELLDDMSETPAKDRDPVPLLTPPTTPIEERMNTGQIAICEWPSNLAVDNAFTAAIELRPLSPSSLAKLEEQDPSKNDLSTPPTFLHQRLRSVSEISSTGLTPMLSSMGMPSSLNQWR